MEIQDTIDAYVKGQLSAAEQADFETALRNDPVLADAVEQARIDLKLANVLIEDEVRDWMSGWENDPVPPPPPARKNGLLGLGFIVLILAAGAGIWYFSQPEPIVIPGQETQPGETQPGELKNESVKPEIAIEQQPSQKTTVPPNIPPTDPRLIALAQNNFKGSDKSSYLRNIDPGQTPPPDFLQLAAEAINKKDYAGAVRQLRTVPATHPEYISAQVLLGETYFLQKQYAQAEQAYTIALRSDKISADAVNWNLLLTYLAQYPTKKSDFEGLLKVILADTDHPDHKEAVLLQAAIK